MSVQDQLDQAVLALTTHYKEYTADGKLTYKEVLSLLCNGAATLIRVVEIFGGGSREDNKKLVLGGLSTFYDNVIAPIDIVGIPNIIEPAVDASIKSLLLVTVEGAADSLFNVFEKMGWLHAATPQALRLMGATAKAQPVMLF